MLKKGSSPEVLTVVLVRPGSTDFDEQGRITGKLNVPLNHNGALQVARTVGELSELEIDAIYASPSQSCRQTADELARRRGLKVKRLESLQNLDLGLWHGKRIEEVRQRQPKVYRQWQDHPETVCPPQGESFTSAQQRLSAVLNKLCRKHRGGVVAIVAPEPLASLARQLLDQSKLGNLWKAELDCGRWEQIEVQPQANGL